MSKIIPFCKVREEHRYEIRIWFRGILPSAQISTYTFLRPIILGFGGLTYGHTSQQRFEKLTVCGEAFEDVPIRGQVDEDSDGIFGYLLAIISYVSSYKYFMTYSIIPHEQLQISDRQKLVRLEYSRLR